ncbi:uncharacterized protein LOC113225663 isoform X1 [Hyposmocoma kahamanoa]|uniref:uncharacterized protein LOC113225663 isoform X1 n=1 Tax=Hyposmocoma kahamanoa TaxID=1477025 RepID=UPI000E6D69B7|nr:uncharacterized protein LOC113225663 isoform X1 [Hyposmocoma kahamanoa]
MKLFGQHIYLFFVILMAICITNAVGCRKAKYPVGNIRAKYPDRNKVMARRSKLKEADRKAHLIAGTTTLNPKVNEVLTQLNKSTFLKKIDKKNYKQMLRQLKDIFHTTSHTVCARCRQN